MDSNVPYADGDRLAETRCSNCEEFVTPQFARVFGDNQNRVRRCLGCTTSRELCNGKQ